MGRISIELYQGFDTFGGRSLETMVATGGRGQPVARSTSSVTVCRDLGSLHDALEIGSSVSVSYGAFSADEKARYVHNLHLTTNSVVVVVRAGNTATTNAEDARVPEHLQPTNRSQVKDFVHEFGDCFVSEITNGGEYFATFTFLAVTEGERDAVVASLDISSDVLDASVAAKISDAARSATVQYKVDQSLRGVTGTPPPPLGDIGGVVDFASGFFSVPLDSVETVSFAVAPYEALLDSAGVFSRVTGNRNNFAGSPAAPGWGQVIEQLRRVVTDCESIKDLNRSNGRLEDSGLEERTNQVKADLAHLLRFADLVRSDPTHVQPFTAPESYRWLGA